VLLEMSGYPTYRDLALTAIADYYVAMHLDQIFELCQGDGIQIGAVQLSSIAV
jgi:hypothetical protein